MRQGMERFLKSTFLLKEMRGMGFEPKNTYRFSQVKIIVALANSQVWQNSKNRT
jgi:hypothetical protein